MKYVILFLSIGMVNFSCTQHNATKKDTAVSDAADIKALPSVDTPEPVTVAEKVAAIKAEYARINALPLRQQTFQWDEENCAADGAVTYFFEKDKIVKAREIGAIGDGSWNTEYYYRDGRFIFSYNLVIGGPAVGPVDTIEMRTYASQDTIIRTIEDKVTSDMTGALLTPASKEYKIIKAYTTKDFAGAFCY